MEIVGATIRLRPLEKRDIELKVKWYNDKEVNQTLVLPESLDLQKTCEWFDRTQKDKSRHEWIMETHDEVPIGIIGIKDINQNNRSGHLYIVIGEKKCWGKGIGYEAELLALHYGFKHLKLHKITGAALENNPASIAAINKVGFHHDGAKRDEYYAHDRYYAVHIYSLLYDEFYEKHPEYKNMPLG